MKSVIFDRFGPPAEVLEIREKPVPEPQQGQVRVRMIAAPVNPSDVMTIQGIYGKLPELPATPGYEGVGVVEHNGGGLLGWRVLGRRVAVLNGKGGNWQEQVVIPARQAVPVSAALSDDQAATFFVNPATAYLLTMKVLKIPPGAWLVQTAANSTLGRMIIRLGRHLGFRTINIVRRPEAAEELSKLGADKTVDSSSQDVEEYLRSFSDGPPVHAIDCVGGETGAAVAHGLGPGGRLIVYGTMADQPMPVESRKLMVGGKSIEGFWLSEWVQRQNPIRMLRLFRSVGSLIESGVLSADIGESFTLDDVRAGVAQSMEEGKVGKTILRIQK